MAAAVPPGAAFTPKSVLVTGGAGFIGSHVVHRLCARYPRSKVVVLDSLNYCASMKNLEGLSERHAGTFKFVHGDIKSADLVTYVMENERTDCILHFAAETHVDNSFGNSFAFTSTNVMGTHVLLEAAKRMGSQIQRFVHVSTDEVYGESRGSDAFFEESVLEPTNPYAASKAAAEFLAKAYHRSFKVPVVITRGNNVYGPNQYPEKLVPKFINQMMRGMPLTVHGDGSTRRNMLYITDVADAFITILEHAQPGSTYNIGGRFEHTVLEIAESVLAHFGLPRDTHLLFVEDRPFNDTRYHIDHSKLLELGWRQKVDFSTGLRMTLDWYKAHADHWGSIERALAPHPKVFGDYATHEPPALHFHKRPLSPARAPDL